MPPTLVSGRDEETDPSSRSFLVLVIGSEDPPAQGFVNTSVGLKSPRVVGVRVPGRVSPQTVTGD